MDFRVHFQKRALNDLERLVRYIAQDDPMTVHPCPCALLPLFCYAMGVSEILDEIKSLPAEQRWQILERTREMLGSEIPESFKQGMREIARGEVIELDEALPELERPE